MIPAITVELITAISGLIVAALAAVTTLVVTIRSANRQEVKLETARKEFDGNVTRAVNAAAEASVVAVDAAFARGIQAEKKGSTTDPNPPKPVP